MNSHSANERISSITTKQLQSALDNTESAINQARGVPNMPAATQSSSDASRFVLSVTHSAAAAAVGSNSERRRHRRRVEAIISANGPPQLFLTLSPNDTGSVQAAQYAGLPMKAVDDLLERLDRQDLGIPVEPAQFFDAEDLPFKSDVWTAVSDDPAAAARFFHDFMRNVIRSVIGVDPDTGQTLKDGGVFGRVRFYYALIESQVGFNTHFFTKSKPDFKSFFHLFEQARQTLHAHILLWIPALPNTEMRFQQAVSAGTDGTFVDSSKQTDFLQNLHSYIDSIAR